MDRHDLSGRAAFLEPDAAYEYALLRMRLALALLVVGTAGFARAQPADAGGRPEAAAPSQRFSAEEIRAAVESHVHAKEAAGGGVYRLTDDRTRDELALEFIEVALVGSNALWRVHNPERQDSAGDAFACVNFRAAGGPAERLYDVDLLLTSRDGKLVVRDAFVHKEPRLVDGRWVKVKVARTARGP